MDDEELLSIAKSLESQADDPKSHLSRCNPPHMVGVIANRDGFLRIAALCLRAACENLPESSELSRPIEPDQRHEQIVFEKQDVTIGFMRRRESWPNSNDYLDELAARRQKSDTMALLGCAAVVVLVVLGIVAVRMWW